MDTIKNIFLTDDDSDDCMIFSELLGEIYGSANPRLTIANDGCELMQKLHETVPPPPNVIFLDINMPRMDGLQCLREIRSTPAFEAIPVVMYSTSASAGMVDRAYQAGANYYLTKSQSYAHLRGSLLQVLSLGAQGLSRQPSRQDFVVRES
jgi:CheY-like chemotaxis protein